MLALDTGVMRYAWDAMGNWQLQVITYRCYNVGFSLSNTYARLICVHQFVVKAGILEAWHVTLSRAFCRRRSYNYSLIHMLR